MLDVVEVLTSLMRCVKAHGQVVNIGSQEEISILELAQKVKAMTASDSEIRLIPYAEAYGEGFEDMLRRVPALDRAWELIRWTPRRNLETILRDVIDHMRQEEKYVLADRNGHARGLQAAILQESDN